MALAFVGVREMISGVLGGCSRHAVCCVGVNEKIYIKLALGPTSIIPTLDTYIILFHYIFVRSRWYWYRLKGTFLRWDSCIGGLDAR